MKKRSANTAAWTERLRGLGRGLGPHLAVLAFFTVATTFLIGNVTLTGSITADVGFDDRLFDARLMRYEFDWLVGRTRGGLFDIDFFFPHPNALATTDPEFGLVLVTLPARLFTDDYLFLTNFAAFLSFILVGHAAFLLARQLTRSAPAALFTAIAFSFCQYRFHQIDHSQILQMQWLLYALYCIHRLALEPGPRWAIPVGIFVFIHGIASLSFAQYSLPLIPLVALWVAFTAEQGKRLKTLAWVSGAGLVAAVALFPFYRPLLVNREIFKIVRDLGEVRMYSGRLEQLWAVPPYNLLYGRSWSAELGRESMTFPGLMVLLFASVGFSKWWPEPTDGRPGWKRVLLEVAIALGKAAAVSGAILLCVRWPALTLLFLLGAVGRWFMRPSGSPSLRQAPALWIYAFAGIVYLLISFGPEIVFRGQIIGQGVWAYLTKIPGYAQVRTPARFYSVTALALALLAGAGLAWVLLQLRSRKVGWAIALVASGLAFAELAVRINERKMITLEQAPRVYTWLKEQPGDGAIVEMPILEYRERYRMFFANIHKRPTVNAESSFHLPSLSWLNPHGLLSNPNQGLVNLLKVRTAGLEYALLHTYEGGGNLIEAHRQMLVAAGAELKTTVDGIEVWRFGERPPVAGFSKDTVAAEITVPAEYGAGGPLNLQVNLAPKDKSIHEPEIRRLRLELEGVPVEGKQALPLYFSPPLFLQGRPESFVMTFPTKPVRGAHTAKARLVDEEGNVWAQAEGATQAR